MTGQPVSIGFTVPAEQRLTYRVHPLPGRLMSARAIGGQIEALGDVLVASAEHTDPDNKWDAFVTCIQTHEDGSIEFQLMIAPELNPTKKDGEA